MKMVMIVYNVGIESEVMELLKELEIEGFTRWPRVQGQGNTSGPHLDSHIWTGVNSVLAVAVEDDRKDKLIERIKEVRKKLGKEGIKAFVLPLENVTE